MDYYIYTDGSCVPNPGKGSWAYVILDKNHNLITENSDKYKETTNNRMELIAVIRALQSIKTPSKIRIYTDSQLITKFNSKGKGKKNRDLIEQLMLLNKFHKVSYQWIKGHNGNKWNVYVDTLAANTRLNK